MPVTAVLCMETHIPPSCYLLLLAKVLCIGYPMTYDLRLVDFTRPVSKTIKNHPIALPILA